MDPVLLRRNCSEFARSPRGIDVLRAANGKNHYTVIATKLGMHATTVSGLLRKAEKLGLAKRAGLGIYKKIPGVLGYMPSSGNVPEVSYKTVTTIARKLVSKRKLRKINISSTSLVIPERVERNLDSMTNAYASLYATENVLRELIRKVLSPKVDWWKNHVPPAIQQGVEKSENTSPYHAAKRMDRLEYTHLGQLQEIIINGKNWDDFSAHLNERDKHAFAATIKKAIPSRNAIGHCIPLQREDLKVVDVRFQDILRMIK